MRSFPPALSVYVPVHVLAVLFRLPKIDLKTLFTDSLRSATFLATFFSQPCIMRRVCTIKSNTLSGTA
jgi:hypothetical protein